VASRYVMKVSEMNELASSQHRVLNDLSRAAEERCKEAYNDNAKDAVVEALARLDALEDLKRLQELEVETKRLTARVQENIGSIVMGYGYGRGCSLSSFVEMGSRYEYLASLPPELHKEMMQVLAERGVAVATYSPPAPSQMVRRFKECKTLAEVKQAMENYQREALTQLAPVLGVFNNQEGA
jgi:hypothetical protein